MPTQLLGHSPAGAPGGRAGLNLCLDAVLGLPVPDHHGADRVVFKGVEERTSAVFEQANRRALDVVENRETRQGERLEVGVSRIMLAGVELPQRE